ncbi:MAG: HAMP domain-containing histidine kinase [Cellvibrionaceae bacterium]|nr:HAMP domain-containing histidine kinase [Cellvibrionaceae bacterium]
MRIKRLFWKIFAAFWLVSICIMIATSYAILASVETEKFRNQYEKTLRNFTERAIDHYEGLPEEKPFKRSLLRRYGPPHNLVNHQHVVSIKRNDEVIFRRDSDSLRDEQTFQFKLTSAKGNRYTVEALTPRPPRHLINMLQRVNTLQFFIILFASTLVSFLLSWSITRPLKKLGAASRQFAQGDLQTAIDKKLLHRADELGDLANDFSYMMRKIQQTISAQKQLLHDVSHELRAPLARLQVAAELIQQREEKPSSYIQRIHAECERMDQLIQRILNFARIEESAANFTNLDLIKLLQSHIDNILFEHPQRQIHFAHGMPNLVINGDQSLLGEAVDNILRNACKYTPDDSVIDVEVARRGENILLVIRDHGLGVASEDLAKLATPFYRSGNRMHGDGFGLGLSIARRALEKHGGKLELSNHAEGGLLVQMEFPHQPR